MASLNSVQSKDCERKYGKMMLYLVPDHCSYDDILNYLQNGKTLDPIPATSIDGTVAKDDKQLFIMYVQQLKENEAEMRKYDERNRGNTITKIVRNDSIVVDTGPYSAWTHYYNHLKKDGFENIEDILSSSKNILEMLSKETEQDRPVKGAVVGSVQSGKTANMEALMSLAADNGWNMFIILSGTIENLRTQTESRMINDLRKKDDEDPLRIEWTTIKPLLSTKDFDNYLNIDLGENSNKRYLSVILKNSSHLKKLINNLTRLNNIDRMNLVVIDDEADQASVNTKKSERTAINRLIINLINGMDANGRKLDRTYKSVNYICYTATPYAILLNESKGLYPGDFITALTPSRRYFGLERIFGSDDYPGMNIIKVSNDISYDIDILREHPENMPNSMKDCIAWFVCCVAVQRFRNFHKPVSLLMNVDVKTDAHTVVDNAVVHYLKDNKEDLLKRCRTMYEERNNFTAEDLENSVWDYGRNSIDQPFPTIKELPPYDAIEQLVQDLVESDPSRIILDENDEKKKQYQSVGMHICVDNCKNDAEAIGNEKNYTSRLFYPEDDDPILNYTPAFIVIGGNTLSRGLTIKGLVATYFQRNNIKQADTLLQMGRWFGFRNGYELLPRIWMDSRAKNAFEILSTINSKLLSKIAEYSQEGISPNDYSVRIMNVPESNMLKSLTARNKSQGAKSSKLDFSGSDKEFHKYPKDHDELQFNINLTRQFIKNIEQYESERLEGSRYLFRNVPKKIALKFLEDFNRPRDHYAASPDMSIRWMEKTDDDTLGDFNVVLSGNSKPIEGMDESSMEFCDGRFRVNKITRNPSDNSATWIRIKTVRDKADMIADIPSEIISSLDKDDRTELLKGDIRIRSDAKRKAGLDITPLLALYIAHSEGCENDVVMAAWYIPKDAKSEEEFDPTEYMYLEEEDL